MYYMNKTVIDYKSIYINSFILKKDISIYIML